MLQANVNPIFTLLLELFGFSSAHEGNIWLKLNALQCSRGKDSLLSFGPGQVAYSGFVRVLSLNKKLLAASVNKAEESDDT